MLLKIDHVDFFPPRCPSSAHYYLNDESKKLVPYITICLRKLQILLKKFNLIFNVKNLIDLKQKQTNIQG
jgi:hypothetical protein